MLLKTIIEKRIIDNEEIFSLSYIDLSIFNKSRNKCNINFYKFYKDCFILLKPSSNEFSLYENSLGKNLTIDEEAKLMNYLDSRLCGIYDKAFTFFDIDIETIISIKTFLGYDLILTLTDGAYFLKNIEFYNYMAIKEFSHISDKKFIFNYLAHFILEELNITKPTIIFPNEELLTGIYPLQNDTYAVFHFDLIQCTDGSVDFELIHTQYFYKSHENFIDITCNLENNINDDVCLDHILNFISEEDFLNSSMQIDALISLV